MTKYAAFLRAINVGGYSIVKMEVLRSIFTSLGLKDVKTYIQSGNVVFDAKENNSAVLNKKIEKHLSKELGFEVINLLRTEKEMEEIIKNNPFDETKLNKDLMLYVVFLPEAPSVELTNIIASLNSEIETFHVKNREIYCLIQRSKMKHPFSNSLIEKKLKMKATTRNWNTVKKMYDILNS